MFLPGWFWPFPSEQCWVASCCGCSAGPACGDVLLPILNLFSSPPYLEA